MRSLSKLLFLTAVSLVGSHSSDKVNSFRSTTTVRNDRPVIGVYTEPLTGSSSSGKRTKHYVAASYVKWLESVGARSIPIPQNADNSTIDAIFHEINGLLLPGGAEVTLPDSLYRLWELAVAENDAGGYFPVWGTCLGFERMVSLVSRKGPSILRNDFDSENVSIPLDFVESTGEESSSSVLFRNREIRRIAATEPVTMNNHRNGIVPSTFSANVHLDAAFRIVSTSKDRRGLKFVSTIEARRYPFFAVQWHPEKNNFEFGTTNGRGDVPYEAVNHSEDAVRVSIEMASVLVRAARRNGHAYDGEFPLMWDYEMRKGIAFEQIFVVDVSEWEKKPKKKKRLRTKKLRTKK